MIPQDTVSLILDTARIEDVVGDFVTLKRRGANYVACCPFHNEKTPSFYVSPSKGIYKCFGCGKAGSAVGFVMEHEHCSYVEALRWLAAKYHIDIVEEEESADEIARRQRRESLLLVSEFAQKFYASQLQTPEGRSVGLAYFRKRGLEDATIARFGLGWAPSGKTALVDAATAAGYKMEYLLAAGLAVQHEDGSVTDKFRERVMFPIHSVSGRVLAFSGRTLHAVVEGNVDMVTLHQLGITNVVASCGTSLTVEQIRLIHKFTENATIMYDGDSAGIHAALRGINLFLAEGLNVKVVLLPEGEDPDSFARKHTLEEMQNYIASGERDFIEFKTDLLLSDAGSDPLKKAELINDIADTIAQIPDPVKRSVYVDTVALRFGIESSILFQRIAGDRKRMQEEALRQRQREERSYNDGSESNSGAQNIGEKGPGTGSGANWQEPSPAGEEYLENRILAPAEQDLLYYLMTYGTEFLEFESDSPYYSGTEEDKPTVADFIREALEADDCSFANTPYRALYDAYFELYDKGLQQEDILKTILNGPDRRLSDLAARFSTRKYQLTVHDFEASLTSTATVLSAGVPKAILVYAERRVYNRLEEIRKSLRTMAPDAQMAALQEMVKLQAAQKRINQRIGRDKKELI